MFVSYPPAADRLVKQLKAVFYDAVARHSRTDEWRATFLADGALPGNDRLCPGRSPGDVAPQPPPASLLAAGGP